MENLLTRIFVSGITAAAGYQIYDAVIGLYSAAFSAISLGH